MLPKFDTDAPGEPVTRASTTHPVAAGEGELRHAGPRALHRLLDAILSISSDLERPMLLQRIVDAAVELVDARYGAIGVLDESGSVLASFVTTGMDAELCECIGQLPTGRGLLGSLIHDAQPLRLAWLGEHPDSIGFPANHPSMTSFLGVPIRVRDEVFGNLYLTDKTTAEAFTDVDEELVTQLAAAAGTVLENARLLEHTQRRQGAERAMRQLANEVAAAGTADDRMIAVARHARDLFGADVTAIAGPRPDHAHFIYHVVHSPEDVIIPDRVNSRTTALLEAIVRTRATRHVVDAGVLLDHDLATVTEPVGPAIFLGLSVGGNPDRALIIGRRAQAATFSELDIELAEVFTSNVNMVLGQEDARRRSHRLSLLELTERAARDSHHAEIELLQGAGLSLQCALPSIDNPAAREQIATAIDQVQQAIGRIQNGVLRRELTNLNCRSDDVVRDPIGGQR